MCEHFDLVIFTSSRSEYADLIIDHIDTWKAIKRRYYRDSCVIEKGTTLKDLNKISHGTNLNTLMVENAPGVVVQRDNMIELVRWEAG